MGEVSSCTLNVGSGVCFCVACGAYFRSATAFDKHRVGQVDRDRRCLTEGEMRAAGMSRDAQGRWITRAFLAKVLRSRMDDAPARAVPFHAPGQNGV